MDKVTIRQVSNGYSRVLLYLLFFLLLLFLHIEFYEYAADDAYIHFRVARNLVKKGVPYYNHDEPLKVSTSSGWTVFISLIFAIAAKLGFGDNFPLLVAIFNVLFLTAIIYLYTRILEMILEKDLSVGVRLLFQIPCLAILLPTSLELMETPFAILIAGIGIYRLLCKNVWGLMYLSFAVYLRPEMVIPFVLAIPLALINQRRKLLAVLLPVLVGLLPIVMFDLYYFGTVVPHSVVAKKAVYSFTYLETFISAIFGALPFIKRTYNAIIIYTLGAFPCVVFFCSLVLINLMVVLKRKHNENLWPLFFCFSSLCTIAGYVLGRAFVFNWYRPLYMLPALLSLAIYSFSKVVVTRKIARAGMIMAIIPSIILLAQCFYATIGDRSYSPTFSTGARVKTYQFVAAILNTCYPSAIILTSEIGGTGYAFRGKIYDAVGLASADAVKFHPMKVPEQRESSGIGAIPPEYVKFKNPDIIVSHDLFAKALQASEVIKQYNAFRVPIYLPEDARYSATNSLWGSKYHNIYIKNSLPISEELKLFITFNR
ncbi:MAG: hypothetical protein GQF41_3636 [Candidatus Rifleibacterium amylolyticum]|nr:MAG: hypothetical protein GQF41_3636 [Candidatus Rifleibacterium amylolyticum]